MKVEYYMCAIDVKKYLLRGLQLVVCRRRPALTDTVTLCRLLTITFQLKWNTGGAFLAMEPTVICESTEQKVMDCEGAKSLRQEYQPAISYCGGALFAPMSMRRST